MKAIVKKRKKTQKDMLKREKNTLRIKNVAQLPKLKMQSQNIIMKKTIN